MSGKLLELIYFNVIGLIESHSADVCMIDKLLFAAKTY